MAGDHFYTSDAFLGLLAEAYFPGARPEVVGCGAFATRTLVHRGRPVTDFWAHPFYHPRAPAQELPTRSVPFLRKAELAVMRPGEAGPAGAMRSSFIDWRAFGSWEEYERYAVTQGMRTTSLDRDERRLARDFGPVQFVWDEVEPETFDAVVRWKIADYGRRRGINRFDTAQNIEFYRELQRRGLMTVSGLWAGDRLVAGQFSHVRGRHTIYRVTTYDYELRKYSPGAIQLRHFLRHRFAAGDQTLDFLWGEEHYKYRYATHVRWLGDVGSEPRLDRWRRRARMRAGRTLSRYPAARDAARSVERAARRVLPL